jgi:GNAT superfamily N-acetyltransferase
MSVADFLRSYDAEVRARPTARSGIALEDDGRVVRLVGNFNFVCSWRFGAADAHAVVGDQVRYFRSLGQQLIWRVHDHDAPRDLGACLAAHGFEAGPAGTLMFLDLRDGGAAAVQGVEVKRVSTKEELLGFLEASDVAFGDRLTDDLYEPYLHRLRDPTFALFSAYVDDAPVGAGRLEWNGRFGQLYGGGVRPEHRGRGVYRALCHARVEEARRQGVRYLSTEARETSRPILERLGFVPAVGEVTWVLP